MRYWLNLDTAGVFRVQDVKDFILFWGRSIIILGFDIEALGKEGLWIVHGKSE